MFHHRKWDDQLLFICSTLRSCKKLVHIDGRQVLYRSFALFLLVAIICSFHHLNRQDQLMFVNILHPSLLQARKDRQVTYCIVITCKYTIMMLGNCTIYTSFTSFLSRWLTYSITSE